MIDTSRAATKLHYMQLTYNNLKVVTQFKGIVACKISGCHG